MARKATGAVVEHAGRDGTTYRSLRFTAYGKRRYVSLGAISATDAERELRHALADVERGTWTEPRAVEPPAEAVPVPTFHQFAEQWWIEREGEWRESTRERYRCCIEAHLLPAFGKRPVDRITIADVDAYKAGKLRDGKLAPATINKQLILLSSILEAAEERELIVRNPARGRRRRVRTHAPRRSYLDTSEQITALLDAAAALDREAGRYRHIHRKAMLATLTFAGLRLGELLNLRWKDVDLAALRLHVGESKTDAGRRHVTIRPVLLDELLELRATSQADRDALVFGTTSGRAHGATNIRKRVFAPVVEMANEKVPMPDHLTPHSLRRTFASVLYAIGEDPPTVMAEMGHSSPALALRIYAQVIRRDNGEKERLKALIEGAEMAVIGSRADQVASEGSAESAARE